MYQHSTIPPETPLTNHWSCPQDSAVPCIFLHSPTNSRVENSWCFFSWLFLHKKVRKRPILLTPVFSRKFTNSTGVCEHGKHFFTPFRDSAFFLSFWSNFFVAKLFCQFVITFAFFFNQINTTMFVDISLGRSKMFLIFCNLFRKQQLGKKSRTSSFWVGDEIRKVIKSNFRPYWTQRWRGLTKNEGQIWTWWHDGINTKHSSFPKHSHHRTVYCGIKLLYL